MEQYEQPINTLHKLKGKEVSVELKNKERVDGKLTAFDLYTNITLETSTGTRFIQGGLVSFIFEKDKEKSPEEEPEDSKPVEEEPEEEPEDSKPVEEEPETPQSPDDKGA